MAILSALSACAVPVSEIDTNDPNDGSSRSIHEFNKGLDQALVGPTAKGYGYILPKVVRRTVSNAAGYLGLPIQAVNNILQADPKGLGQTVLRFTVNSLTFGLGDLATEAGIPDNNADFGQTLHVWGVGQGAYLEMPVLGPSTTRDTVGFLIDTAINPVNYIIPNEPLVGPSFYILDRLSDRNQYSDVIEETLYNSDDSHATAKSLSYDDCPAGH